MPAEILLDTDLELPERTAQDILTAYSTVAGSYLAADAEVCIRVCGEQASRTLNQSFRQQDKPTNVLSFPAEVSVEGVSILGDIALCWPLVEQEAAAQGKPVTAHLTHLVIHGLLHLIGHDHQRAEEAQIMEDLERQLLAELAIADPYR